MTGHKPRAKGLRPASWIMLLPIAAHVAACDYVFPPPEQRYRGIDVYADRYEFRFNTYTSIRRLDIALEATTDDIEELNVRECVNEERLTEILNLLRQHGQANVAVSMPDDC
jgi:hypothetical protein